MEVGLLICYCKLMDDTQLTPDQIAEKGQKIYEEKLKVILGERKGVRYRLHIICNMLFNSEWAEYLV